VASPVRFLNITRENVVRSALLLLTGIVLLLWFISLLAPPFGLIHNEVVVSAGKDTAKSWGFVIGSGELTVGYGKSRPKNERDPMDPSNRRVQVVNMDTKTAANSRQ